MKATSPDESRLALNAASWEYANQSFNRNKADFAAAIQSGVEVVPPELFAVLSPRPTDRVLHLMCNDGREAAYISRISKAHIHGVDFSESAVSYAKALNDRLALGNDFTVDDVEHFLATSESSYTKALITLGSLRWIADIPRFVAAIRARLTDDGSLVIWDFHPVVGCLSSTPTWSKDYPAKSHTYHRGYGVLNYAGSDDTYRLLARNTNTDADYANPYRVIFSEHPLSSVVTAITASGPLFEPVRNEAHPELVLHLQIAHVSSREIGRGRIGEIVAVHEHCHREQTVLPDRVSNAALAIDYFDASTCDRAAQNGRP